jgi:hypothetical protein
VDTEKGPSLTDRLESLFQTLSEIDVVTRRDEGDEFEARTLAYSLVEIEESCRCYLDRLAKLEAGEAPLDQLEEMSEDLRHILYHIRDSRFLRVIDPAGEG